MVYLFSAYLLKRYEKSVNIFLWGANEQNDPKTKIAFEYLTAPRNDGGLKLIDLRKKDYAIKIQWIKRLKQIETLHIISFLI